MGKKAANNTVATTEPEKMKGHKAREVAPPKKTVPRDKNGKRLTTHLKAPSKEVFEFIAKNGRVIAGPNMITCRLTKEARELFNHIVFKEGRSVWAKSWKIASNRKGEKKVANVITYKAIMDLEAFENPCAKFIKI
jgi:hypothetical protein